MGKVKWKNVLKKAEEAIAYFNTQQVRPTLRTLFYRLVSQGVLPHTDNYYKSLSSHMVDWRKTGHFSWDCLADKGRSTLGQTADADFNEEELDKYKKTLESQTDFVDLDMLLDDYFGSRKPDFSYGRWTRQSKIVEIWIEKEALADTFATWLGDLDVKIRVNKGYSSWTFAHENIKDLKDNLETHEKVEVIYLGDHDPSGLDIDRFLQEALNYFGVDPSNIELQRGALTLEQAKKYNLPSESVNKKDPRAEGYINNYGDKAWELDALLAYAPEKFRKELQGMVKQHFDREKYEKVKNKAEELNVEAELELEGAKIRTEERLRNELCD